MATSDEEKETLRALGLPYDLMDAVIATRKVSDALQEWIPKKERAKHKKMEHKAIDEFIAWANQYPLWIRASVCVSDAGLALEHVLAKVVKDKFEERTNGKH